MGRMMFKPRLSDSLPSSASKQAWVEFLIPGQETASIYGPVALRQVLAVMVHAAHAAPQRGRKSLP